MKSLAKGWKGKVGAPTFKMTNTTVKRVSELQRSAQRLSRTGSIALHSGRTVKYEAADILHLGATRVAGDALVKFNRTECRSFQYSYTGADDPVLDDEDNEDEGEIAQFFATDDVE